MTVCRWFKSDLGVKQTRREIVRIAACVERFVTRDVTRTHLNSLLGEQFADGFIECSPAAAAATLHTSHHQFIARL